jgi:hypothetical protein
MRLICFGDSWTAGFGIEENKSKYKFKILDIANGFYEKLRINNCWPRWLSNEFDCAFVTFARSGQNNREIFNDIKNLVLSNVLKGDDIIIVMLSYPYRGKTNPISDFEDMEELLNPYIHFYFNGFYPMFKNETYNNIPNYFIDPESTMLEMLINYEKKNPETKPIWEYDRKIEWNSEIINRDIIYHPNMFGYKLIAKHIYKKLKEKNFNLDNKIKNKKFL